MDTDPKPRPTYSVIHSPGSSAHKRVEALPASAQREPHPTESSVRSHSAGPRPVSATRPGRTCAGVFNGQSGCAIPKYFYRIWFQNSGLLPGLPEMVPDVSGHNTELAKAAGFHGQQLQSQQAILAALRAQSTGAGGEV